MELIIPFKKSNFTPDGIYLLDGRFVLEHQQDWEKAFHNKFEPYYANVIEGHPMAMYRLTKYVEGTEETNYDFGMDLINGGIDIDTNLAIEEYLEKHTVYAIGSQLHDDEDNPLFLIKNEKLSEEILLLRYDSEDDEDENPENVDIVLSNREFFL